MFDCVEAHLGMEPTHSTAVPQVSSASFGPQSDLGVGFWCGGPAMVNVEIGSRLAGRDLFPTTGSSKRRVLWDNSTLWARRTVP